MTPSPDIPEREIRERCASLLSASAEEARRLNHNYIGTEHLFMAVIQHEDGPTAVLLKRAGLNPRHVYNELRRDLGKLEGPMNDDVLPLTPRAEIVLSLAIFLAEREEDDEIDETHLLLALLQEGEGIPVRKLVDMGFNLNLWLQKLIIEIHGKDLPDAGVAFDDSPHDFDFPALADDDFNFEEDSAERSPKSRGGNRMPTPLLDKYGTDLTQQAAQGKIGPAISRDSEIRSLARTLLRSITNNPLLLGDSGVGKTAVVEGLAWAIHEGTAPKSLLDKRIVQIDIGVLVAGTSLRGQFEERLIGIVDEVKNAGNVILFIDEIHTIVGAGDTIDSNLDAANILKPALQRGDIVCIGATTHEEYRRAIAQDPALDRRFGALDIEEPSQEDTLTILSGRRQRLEEHHGVTIRPEAMEAAVRMSVRFLPDRRLPAKALVLVDQACTRITLPSQSPDEDTNPGMEVRVETIAQVLSEMTGIPVTDLTKDEKRRLAALEETLLKRVIGQDKAVKTISAAIKTARAGLGNPNRPIGVFLFLGPSGVGKTELARALATFLFGSDEAMIRLDMSEFHDSHTVARLIGAPPGYKDTQRGGQLTDALRRRPYSVVLLDEVEKAAPEVFDIFLQVFDEGRLSDAHGKVVDARHSVFIMTSNIGTEETGKVPFGFQRGPIPEPDYEGHLKQFFRPEFLNRLDETITFRALDQDTMSKILDLQLGELHQRLAEQNLKLVLSDEARAFVLEKGYDPVNGARPLRRAIERLLTRPLSGRIVEDIFTPGDTVTAFVDEGERLRFEAATRS